MTVLKKVKINPENSGMSEETSRPQNKEVTTHFIYSMHVAQDMKGIIHNISHHMHEDIVLQRMLEEHAKGMMRLLHLRYPELKLEMYV